MATPILMPRMSDSMIEGTLVKWLKAEGTALRNGDLIAEIETDKATQEVEVFEQGVLLKHAIPEGGVVAVGGVIAVIGKSGEDISGILSQSMAQNATQAAMARAESSAKTADEGRAPTPAPTAASPSVVFSPPVAIPDPAKQLPAPVGRDPARDEDALEGGRLRASPVARKLAAQHGISLFAVQGTGPGGRITRHDVTETIEGRRGRAPLAPVTGTPPVSAAFVGSPAPADEKIPLTNMRRTIARRLLESKTTIPHFYSTVEIDAQPLADLRVRLNEGLAAADDPLKISVNDLVLFATSRALAQVPALNATWSDDHILRFGAVHLAFAVSMDGGLITPVLRNADQKGLRQLALEAKELGRRAKDKALKPEEFSGGTFTVSNLGMFGIDTFQAIVNPPQAGILAVGSTVRKPVVAPDGSIVAGLRMNLTLSGDHRTVDGVVGAQFLNVLRRLLENPATLLV